MHVFSIVRLLTDTSGGTLLPCKTKGSDIEIQHARFFFPLISFVGNSQPIPPKSESFADFSQVSMGALILLPFCAYSYYANLSVPMVTGKLCVWSVPAVMY